MSRRRFGSIRRRASGNYQVRYRGPDGLVYPAPMTFQRKGDAERWLALLEAEIVRDNWSSPTVRRVDLGDYSDRWVRERKLQPRTRELYESLLRNHIRPYLGGRSLDKINSQAVRTWRKRLLDDGRTAIVAAKSYRLLRAVLNTAVNEDRLLSENPCRMRGYDKEETAERPAGSISAVIALSELIERRYRALVLFAAFTGLRWGEMVALRVCDLDLGQGTVRVARKFAELQDGRRVAGPPKSWAGVRTVALPAVLVQGKEMVDREWP
jgi:integrase